MGAFFDSVAKLISDGVNKKKDGVFLNHDPLPCENPGLKYSWRHYGVMVPDVGERDFFDVMNIIGRPGVDVFDVDGLGEGEGRVQASILSTTGATEDSGFEAHSNLDSVWIDPVSESANFGERLSLSRRGSVVQIRRELSDAKVSLDLDISDTVSYFANIPGLYQHWSALARCVGTVEYRGGVVDVITLGTVEFARGIGTGSFNLRRMPNIPVKIFCYHILNISDSEQILMTDVGFTDSVPVQRRVYYRKWGQPDRVIDRKFISNYGDLSAGPDPRSSSLVPEIIEWSVGSGKASHSVKITGVPDGNWKIGIGSGYCGTYSFSGTCFGRDVQGQAYLEFVHLP